MPDTDKSWDFEAVMRARVKEYLLLKAHVKDMNLHPDELNAIFREIQKDRRSFEISQAKDQRVEQMRSAGTGGGVAVR
jgi:hypothetical protein